MVKKANLNYLEDILKLIKLGVKHGKVLLRSKAEVGVNINSFFIYVEGKKVVGCASLEVYNSKLAEVRSLVVDYAYQGQGIGYKLVKRCIREAKKKGVLEVLAVTDQDQFFWKAGFRKSLENQYPMFLKLRERGRIGI